MKTMIYSEHKLSWLEGSLTLMPSLGVIPCKYPDKLYLSRS